MNRAKNDNERKWYIVACRPNSERQAGAEILALGQTVFVPCFRREYHHRRKRKWIKQSYPLLPGYLFVLASAHWSRVLDCEHVQRVLRSQLYGETAAPISIADGDVQAIRLAQDSGQFDDLRIDRFGIKPGDLVKVGEGAFTGTQGTVETIGDENIVLLIAAMGRELRTTVSLEKVRQAG